MKICKAAIVALFIIINIYCCAVWADEAAEPVLSFELEDGTQVLNQDSVIKASLIRQTDNLGNPEFMIEITFDEEGKEAFRKATTEHAGELIRILVNGDVISAPRIQEPVTEGKCVLTGDFTQSEAEELILVLDPVEAAVWNNETETEVLLPMKTILVSEDDAYDSVYDYVDETIGMREINKHYGYIVPKEETDEDYVIEVKSYTSAIGYYYVNKYTGDVFSAWSNPVTNETDGREYEYTIDAQELERLHKLPERSRQKEVSDAVR